MTRMIGYTRRSKANRNRPDDPALGIAAQRTAITTEADRRGWDIAWTDPDDGWSGRNVTRPGLQAALALLAGGEADGLVVAKLNRLSRSMQDFATLLTTAGREGWCVVALDLGIDTTTVNGRLVANLVMAVSEWEREVIGERTAEALAEVRDRGVRLGRPRLAPADVVARIVEARDGQQLSYYAIARALTEDGVLSPMGLPTWQASSVRRLYAATTRQCESEVA